ncbi:hypothetical protein BDW66DRAFT_92205 [Aspergillus desertorum]
MSLTMTASMHDDLPSPNPSISPSTDLSLSSSTDHDHDLSETDVDIDIDIDPEIDADDATITRIQAKLAKITALYNSGKPLFPRALLASLDAQIDRAGANASASIAEANKKRGSTEEKENIVTIPDLDDIPHTYSLKVPAWCVDFATTYRIGYSSIQNLTCIHPSFPEISLRDSSPVSICYTSSPEYGRKVSFEQVKDRFKESVKRWESSQTCADLRVGLGDLVERGQLTKKVRKIVGFGLGSLSLLEEEFCVGRAHAQHAAIGTMVAVLRQRQAKAVREMEKESRDWIEQDRDSDLMATETGMHNFLAERKEGEEDDEIKCYAQDPAYTEADRSLLRSIGIQPLDDPKGFLEIDDETLVFSVSPNVPVKQIVADVQWPGAMIWNTVAEEEQEARWEKKLRDGEEFWVVPFTTDPDSQRVRDMVQHYTSVPLRDSNEFFGDLTIYVR